MSALPDRELARARAAKRLRDDLELYSRECLKIRVKRPDGSDGGIHPLRLNASQRYLHERIEAHKAKHGKVRIRVLKSRQVGISTYIAARFFHRATHSKGVRCFILTHLDDATDNLFGMVRRFHDMLPDEVKPSTSSASAKELSFDVLHSGYKVGTAGSKAIGRSDTIQLFHGSEQAFWPNADEHSSGIGQAIADAPGTEDIRESTANGIGGSFHSEWVASEKGKSEFENVFIPWFLHEEYSKAAPADWHPPEKFEALAATYNLTREQLYWAWLKNREFSASGGTDPDQFSWKFQREYPSNSVEAFMTSGENHFIPPEAVVKARKAKLSGYGPLILGVDPSWGGADTMGMVDRQGRVMGANVNESYITNRDNRVNAGRVVQVVKQLKAKGLPLRKVCIDCSGGGGLYDIVRDQLGDELVVGVAFGDPAYDTEHYANRRAEMWDQMRQWFNDPAGVRIPDEDEFQRDINCTAWGSGMTHQRPNGQLVLEPKDKIKVRLKRSPDKGDAAALTFAVDYSELREPEPERSGAGRVGAAGWLT